MLAYAVAAAVLGTRRPVSRIAVGLIADGNIVWALASVLVLVLGWLEPDDRRHGVDADAGARSWRGSPRSR